MDIKKKMESVPAADNENLCEIRNIANKITTLNSDLQKERYPFTESVYTDSERNIFAIGSDTLTTIAIFNTIQHGDLPLIPFQSQDINDPTTHTVIRRAISLDNDKYGYLNFKINLNYFRSIIKIAGNLTLVYDKFVKPYPIFFKKTHLTDPFPVYHETGNPFQPDIIGDFNNFRLTFNNFLLRKLMSFLKRPEQKKHTNRTFSIFIQKDGNTVSIHDPLLQAVYIINGRKN